MSAYLLTVQQWIAYFYDIFLTVLFFRSLPRPEGIIKRLLSVLPLLLLYPVIYSPTVFHYMALGCLWRWGVIYLYLSALGLKSRSKRFYFSALCTICFLTTQNFIVASRKMQLFFIQDAVIIAFIRLIMEYFVPLLVCLFCPSKIDFKKTDALNSLQLVFLVVLIPLLIFVKNTFLGMPSNAPSVPPEWFAFPLIISMLAIILAAYFDRFFILRKEREEQSIIELTNEYRYENLKSQLSAQNDVHRLYHDMKNHLVAIASLGSEEQRKYINGLVNDMETINTVVEVGEPTLNALLGQKVTEAMKKNVSMKVSMDFSPVSFMDAKDLCAIFGNALDNAIDAAAAPDDDEYRFVSVKGGVFANLYVVTITNSYAGTLTAGSSGLLKTTKSNASQHGIGMRSMRQALQKYNGLMVYSAEDMLFTLKFSIPLNEAAAE